MYLHKTWRNLVVRFLPPIWEAEELHPLPFSTLSSCPSDCLILQAFPPWPICFFISHILKEKEKKKRQTWKKPPQLPFELLSHVCLLLFLKALSTITVWNGLLQIILLFCWACKSLARFKLRSSSFLNCRFLQPFWHSCPGSDKQDLSLSLRHIHACLLHICVNNAVPGCYFDHIVPLMTSFCTSLTIFFSYCKKTKTKHLFALTELTELNWTIHPASFNQYHNVNFCLCSTRDLPASTCCPLLYCHAFPITNGKIPSLMPPKYP